MISVLLLTHKPSLTGKLLIGLNFDLRNCLLTSRFLSRLCWILGKKMHREKYLSEGHSWKTLAIAGAAVAGTVAYIRSR